MKKHGSRFMDTMANSKTAFVLLIVLNVIMAISLNFFIGQKYMLGNQVLFGTTLSAAIMLVQLLISIYAVLVYRKLGFIIFEGISLFSLVSVVNAFMRTMQLNVIVCIGISFCTILVMFILHVYEGHSQRAANLLIMQATTDFLTGVFNRRKLMEDMKNAVLEERLHGPEAGFALVMLNLDDFKKINEVRGHECGDDVLREVANRWKQRLGEFDSIYRVNGDEFAIIFRMAEENDSFEHRLRGITNVLHDAIVTDKYENYLTVSCGIVKCPEHSEDVDQLLRYGLAALNSARAFKNRSRRISTVRYFNDQLLQVVVRELDVCDALRKAVEDDLLWIMYQPQYDSQTRKLKGFEALLRMKDLHGNFISPVEFIPIAEKHGLIWNIGSWVMKNAMLSFNAALSKAPEYLRDVTISINVSSIQLLSGYFVETCKEMLEECDFNPKNLIIEITESVFIDSLDKAIETIEELHEIGVSFSIDDFGTGFSSMSYLQRLPINELKIDKSFIDKIVTSEKTREFINMMIYVGHQMNLNVVAEGIEDETQYNLFKSMQGDIIQGYYFSKPVDDKNMKLFMRESCA